LPRTSIEEAQGDRPGANSPFGEFLLKMGWNETYVRCLVHGKLDLEVFEFGRVLHFLSIAYFWRVGPCRIPIPTLLTPGRTHVLHLDEGQGRFRFVMGIRHPVLGLTFYQEGLFN